jgi:hypothetical protein
LFPDRIRVTGWGLRIGRFDETVALSILRPQLNRQWVRNRVFWVGVLLLVWALLHFGYEVAVNGPAALENIGLLVLCWSAALAGLLIVLVNAHPVEFANFPTHAGPVGLSIHRVGPQVRHFDEFIELVLARIQQASSRVESSPEEHVREARLGWLVARSPVRFKQSRAGSACRARPAGGSCPTADEVEQIPGLFHEARICFTKPRFVS